MWMNASSTMEGANTLVLTPWAATSAAAKRASSSATTSTHASTALLVSVSFCRYLCLLVVLHRKKKTTVNYTANKIIHIQINDFRHNEGRQVQAGSRYQACIWSSNMLWEKSLCPRVHNKLITATRRSVCSVSQISLRCLCFVFLTEVNLNASSFHSIGS